jgi:hypothetical protein
MNEKLFNTPIQYDLNETTYGALTIELTYLD